MLKEIQVHPDFKESLIENEKSSLLLDDSEDSLRIESADDSSQMDEQNYFKRSCEELNIDSEKDKTTGSADNKEISSSDIAAEIEKVIMSLASISANHEDVFSHTGKYLKELIRLSLLGDALSISSISNLSDWCQRNFTTILHKIKLRQINTSPVMVNAGIGWSISAPVLQNQMKHHILHY